MSHMLGKSTHCKVQNKNSHPRCTFCKIHDFYILASWTSEQILMYDDVSLQKYSLLCICGAGLSIILSNNVKVSYYENQ